jgi:hypothetical protein
MVESFNGGSLEGKKTFEFELVVQKYATKLVAM